jgi:nucleoside-diphosphate-sugar epimerase
MSIVPAYLQPVAVFGATGKQGGSVVHHLAAAGVRVIAITRTPAGPKSALFPEGVDVRHGDLDAPETLGAALNGAKSVFLVTDFCRWRGTAAFPSLLLLHTFIHGNVLCSSS